MQKPALLDSISPGFKALAAQFLAAGLDLPAILAAGPSALKDHIASAVATAKSGIDVPAAIEAATKELQAQLTAEQGKISALSTQLSAHTAAVVKFGATPKSADEKTGLTAADIESALAARASILASEQLAQHGFQKGAALPVAPAADPTKPAAAATPPLTGLAKVHAAFTAESAAAAARRAI